MEKEPAKPEKLEDNAIQRITARKKKGMNLVRDRGSLLELQR